MSDRLADVKALAAQINKKFGEDMVVLGSEVTDMIPRIPSGSLSLDIVLGGGWPANQWIEIIGDESSGKTAVALKTIAANQQRDPDFIAVWVAAEKWVVEYAEMCGVDTGRVFVVETNDMETAYNAAIDFAASKEVDCIVIDSLPALVPGDEDEKTMEGSTVGRGALLTGKFFRKVGKATKRSLTEAERPVLGIVINQWRQKIGVMYGDPRTTPGGVGKNYAYFVRAEVRRGDWIEVGTGKDKERVGQTIQIRTIKNKTAPAQRVAFVDFYFAEGGTVAPGDYDFAKEILAIGMMEDVIERKGAFYSYDGQKWRGKEEALAAIREDVDLYEKVRDEVVDIIAKSVR
jgi:recombination protein RecA